MAAFTFNIALGREVELYNRVDTNDPTNSQLVMLVLALTGLESDTVLRTYDTVGALLAGASNEVGNTGYSRKLLTDSSLSAFSVDDVNNKITLVLPLQTFTTITAGDTWRKVIVAYDPDSTGGSDTDLIPMVAGDVLINGVPVVPDGTNILIDYSSGLVVAR